MSTLEKAISIAALAHAGQKDKAGEPYVGHLFRVMLKLDAYEDQIVAVLHDIIEDTDVDLYSLKEAGFSANVLEAVWAVTRQADESYQNFICRAKANPIGRRVKMADLEDNCDLMRLPTITDLDVRRTSKYRKALAYLKEAP